MKRRLCLLTVLAAVLFALAGCGSSSSSSSPSGAAAAPGASTTTTIEHAKAKFALHAGLAFGAFHRWIYKPAKAGTLTHPLRHKLTAVKAGLAAGFVYHELKLALTDAQADPALSKLVAPITALQNRIHGVRSGTATPDEATGLNGAISSIKQQSSAAGQPITEQAPASPGG
jgi:predicted small lipoprotein YifL